LAADVAVQFSNQVLDATSPVTVAIEGKFDLSEVSGTVVQMATNAPVSEPNVYVALFDDAGQVPTGGRTTPDTVQNFLSYVNSSAYDNSLFHRSVSGFVLQGGGFTAPSTAADQPGSDPTSIVSGPVVQNEPGNSNVFGTIAMARLGADPNTGQSNVNSATNQFFFNMADNEFLDTQNGGFTTFGEVLGSGMTAISTMNGALTYDATEYYFNSALSELPLYNINTDNIVQAQDFVKINTVDVVSESDLMTYEVTTSDSSKLTASFDSNGDLVLTPLGTSGNPVVVTVTATSILDDTTASDTFSVTLGGDGPVAPVLTAIEEVGNTVLNRDQDGRLYVGGTAVMSGNTHVAITTFAGYEIVAAEAEDGVNKLLLRRTNNNALHAWTLDAQWSRTGADGGVYAVGNSRFYDYESLFGIDVDGGGAGQAPLTAYESNGSIVLQQDGDGKLYVDGTAIMAGSTHATITTFAGYEIIAAEAEDGVNKLLLRRTSTNALHAWTLDAQWNRTGADGGVYAPGNSSFYDYEALFGIDVDGNGEGS
jgi:cyclophilin family peptidyl-prolyl cis-trans isomerase